jgi:chemotaxis protein methyltransferase CheR
MTTPLMDPAMLDQALIAWAHRHLGFDRRALRLERLRSIAWREAIRLGQPAFEAALHKGEPGLDAALTAAATVGETYFFRQPEHFELLRRFPFQAAPGAPLRAWSAACASGEEAYSLAVTLRQHLGLEAPALQVWGTDINQAALDSAKAASYGKWSFRASVLESEAVDRVAEATRNEALRRQVQDPKTQACMFFARHNLLQAPSFDGLEGPRFHLIFCRNALVYFQSDAAEQAIGHLVRALLPGGWLILGNMDIARCPAGMRQVGSSRLCIFERIQDGPLPVAAPKAKAAAVIPFQRPQAAGPQASERDMELAIDWHRGVMAQLEAGEEAAAMLELQALIEAFPNYLPGCFEHGLALNRRGQKDLAAQSLRRVLELARRQDPDLPVPGPEELSLDFYVSNADAFLQSRGDAQP